MPSSPVSTYAVCIDGTWNGPGDPEADPIDPAIETGEETNVHRVFRFLTGELHAPTQLDDVRQSNLIVSKQQSPPGRVLYLAGVGSSGNWLNTRFSGATGYGTMRRILDGYRFLAEHHRDGDRIFGFGFSRGAYAVRSLAGLLHHVGLPRVPRVLTDAEVDDVAIRYKNQLPGRPGFRPVDVDFLGIWDTVGALKGDTSFHDVSPPNVRCVAHALALDEQRQQFEPTYWTGNQKTQVEEVWFAGVHSNIGGGYENAQLSNIALAWMMSMAVHTAGLPADSEYIPEWKNENTFGFARDSYREFLAPLGRLGHLFKKSPRARQLRPTHGVHVSVFDRIERVKDSLYVTSKDVLPADWEAYRPAALLNGYPLPDVRAGYPGPIVETPDYLDSSN